MTSQEAVTLIPLEHKHPFMEGLRGVERGGKYGLLLDPLCSREASTMLFTHCAHLEPVPLFSMTALADSLPVSPWLVPVRNIQNPLFQWLRKGSVPGWGLFFYTSYAWDDICSYLHSLLLVRESRGDDVRELVFRFWDNRIFMRIAKGLPQACARLMGPLQIIVTQDEHGAWFRVENPSSPSRAWSGSSLWYDFDDAHAALFSDKTIDVLAYNVAESLYPFVETEGLPLPPAESLQDFARRQVGAALRLGLAGQEELTSYVVCALYLGEEAAFREASAVKSGRAELLQALWRRCAAEAREEAPI